MFFWGADWSCNTCRTYHVNVNNKTRLVFFPFGYAYTVFVAFPYQSTTSRVYERGVQGVHRIRTRILGGPGLRGPGRVEVVVALSFGQNFFPSCPLCVPDFGQKKGTNFGWRLFLFFVLVFTWIWAKIGPILSEDLFFDLFVCTSRNFGGPASILVPAGKISLWGPDYETRRLTRLCLVGMRAWTKKSHIFLDDFCDFSKNIAILTPFVCHFVRF